MNQKASKKIEKLKFSPKEKLKTDNCKKLKGGGYWCCIRNQWMS